MADETKTIRQQQEAKTRCAQFILEMIEKYGADIQDEVQPRDEALSDCALTNN